MSSNQQFESENAVIGKVPLSFFDRMCSYCMLDHIIIKVKILGAKFSFWPPFVFLSPLHYLVQTLSIADRQCPNLNRD